MVDFQEALTTYQQAQEQAAQLAVDGLTLREIEPAVWATLETVAAAHRAGVASAVASIARQAGVEVDAFDVNTGQFTIKGAPVGDSLFRPNLQESLLSITAVLAERLRQIGDVDVVASEFQDLFQMLASGATEQMVADLYGPDGASAWRARLNYETGKILNPFYSLANLQAWSEQGSTEVLLESVAQLGELDAYVNWILDSDFAPRIAADPDQVLFLADTVTSGPDDGLIRFVTGLGFVPEADFWTTRAAYVAAAALHLNVTVSVTDLQLPGVGKVFADSLGEAVTELPETIGKAAAESVLRAVDGATQGLLDQLAKAPGRTLGALAVIVAGIAGLFLLKGRR
jgi:hypothetical protein